MTVSLKEKALWVWKETLKIHGVAPSTRLASSLSPIELFVALYYGGVLRHDPSRPRWEGRDRLVVSKGHGAIALYPILADLGFFPREELKRVGQQGSFLGGIPDVLVPGVETVNGSLGHGLGVGCGMALALRTQGRAETVFVVAGDGELYEGSVWEAAMFAGHQALDNLVVILDYNKISMLDYCRNIIDLEPLADKFRSFKWSVTEAAGHDAEALVATLARLKGERSRQPKILIAHTVKGRGVPVLEQDRMCHLRTLSAAEIGQLLRSHDAP